jgi:hypothetical protein
MSKSNKKSRPLCPKCGSRAVVPIIYGYPAPSLSRKAARGEVSLGGCCIVDGMPDWSCRTCHNEWA